MNHYYINKNNNTNPNRNNEVHSEDCALMPLITNKEYLGYFNNGIEAVNAAKLKGYFNADGCVRCCPEAHRE